jgi:DNA-binding transcriptional regulator GbsR (MarR family)
MEMTAMMQSCVLHFGEMGSRWGINRTVGQVYAVLVLTAEPLCADDLVAALGVSRSNISMALKELIAWELVRLQHKPGERKEFYSAPGTMWDIAKTLIEQRRKREMDPTLSVLRDLLLGAPGNEADAYAQSRMREMHDLIEQVTRWSQEIQRLDSHQLETLLKWGNGLGRILEMKDRFLGGGAKSPSSSTL